MNWRLLKKQLRLTAGGGRICRLDKCSEDTYIYREPGRERRLGGLNLQLYRRLVGRVRPFSADTLDFSIPTAREFDKAADMLLKHGYR